MYVNWEGKKLPDKALEARNSKGYGRSWSIWWNRIEPVITTYDKINELLDKLDNNQLTYKETKQGCYTLATLRTLGIGYFIRKNKDDQNNIEVCGGQEDDEGDIRLFRYKVSQNYDEEFGALDAWMEFRFLVKEKTGKGLNTIFGGLPLEYHQFRYCVPSPINWAHSWYRLHNGSIAESCVKADICSAYGTEASKTLPDCHWSRAKLVEGRQEPNADYPFAFYLKSGHIAIWQEGDTMELNLSPYITKDHTIAVDAEDDETLLLPAAECTLRDVFEELYEGRKDNPNNKAIMNMTIGMFHRKKNRLVEDNLWPLAAVIKFRCNKRIVDTCEWLQKMGQKPLLINTDSILWQGGIIDEMDDIFVDDKQLGNFTYEYKNCRAVIRSSKIYQVQDVDTGEVITRWSGSHTKKYTSMLEFGQIWSGKVYDFLRELEDRNIVRWDNKKRRFINRQGMIYRNTEFNNEEEAIKWLKNKQD